MTIASYLQEAPLWTFCKFAMGAAGIGVLWFLALVAIQAVNVLAHRVTKAAKEASAIAGDAIGVAVAWPLEWGVDRADRIVAVGAEWRTQRAIWRKEFRKTMSWAEFRREMVGQGTRDELANAVNLFGLPEGFSRVDLDAQYRRVMQFAHPDKGGSQYLAQLMNDARALILERKGWKK